MAAVSKSEPSTKLVGHDVVCQHDIVLIHYLPFFFPFLTSHVTLPLQWYQILWFLLYCGMWLKVWEVFIIKIYQSDIIADYFFITIHRNSCLILLMLFLLSLCRHVVHKLWRSFQKSGQPTCLLLWNLCSKHEKHKSYYLPFRLQRVERIKHDQINPNIGIIGYVLLINLLRASFQMELVFQNYDNLALSYK